MKKIYILFDYGVDEAIKAFKTLEDLYFFAKQNKNYFPNIYITSFDYFKKDVEERIMQSAWQGFSCGKTYWVLDVNLYEKTKNNQELL